MGLSLNPSFHARHLLVTLRYENECKMTVAQLNEYAVENDAHLNPEYKTKNEIGIQNFEIEIKEVIPKVICESKNNLEFFIVDVKYASPETSSVYLGRLIISIEAINEYMTEVAQYMSHSLGALLEEGFFWFDVYLLREFKLC